MNNIKSFSLISLAAFAAFCATAVCIASAQTVAVMPVLYNQAGNTVNVNTNKPLAAGTYFLAPGGSITNEVQYYGNGMYYNPSIGLYGGSVNADPNGLAGVSLNYVASVENAPGIPNTGAGGEAYAVWAALALSGLVAAAGLAYLIKAKQTLVLKPE